MNKKIFISHASKDKEIADLLVDLMQTGLNIPSEDIFCTSLEGLRIPVGSNFIEHIKKQLVSPEVVISLLSPNYFQSQFCLCELGATWAMTHKHIPILIPPASHTDINGVLTGTQVVDIKNKYDLSEFQESIAGILKIKVNQTRWEKKRDNFLIKLPNLLDELFQLKKHKQKLLFNNFVSNKIEGTKREITLKKYNLEKLFYFRCTTCSNTIIRCRGGSSIFSISSAITDVTINRNMDSSSFEEIERERKKLYVKFLERGYQYKYIIELNVNEWINKNYTKENCISKLDALKDFFQRYKDHPNLNVVLKKNSDSQMYIIFGDFVIVESTKQKPTDRRAYDLCRIHNDKTYIDHSIYRFEDEFNSLLNQNAEEWGLVDIEDTKMRNLKILECITEQYATINTLS